MKKERRRMKSTCSVHNNTVPSNVQAVFPDVFAVMVWTTLLTILLKDLDWRCTGYKVCSPACREDR